MTDAPHNNENDRKIWERVRRQLPRQSRSSCPDAIELAAYLDGNASEGPTHDLEDHLSTCPACLDALGELRVLMGGTPGAAPLGVIDRAKGLIAEQARPVRRARWRFPWPERLAFPRLGYSFRLAAAGVAVAVVCVTGVHLGQSTLMNHIEIRQSSLSAVSFKVCDFAECELGDFKPIGE